MSKIKIWRSFLLVVALSCADMLHAASCEYNIRNEWNAGFTAAIVVTNDSAEALDGWSVSWTYNGGSTISQIWSASLSGATPYVATNLGYNGQIAPNASIEFGFNGNKGVTGAPAEIPELGGVCSGNTPVNLPPVALASALPTQGTVPFDVTFDASGSSDPDNDTLTYRWDFGNGDISTNVLVTRTFDEAGDYPVTLTVNDGEFESGPVSITIVANEDIPNNQPPVASADVSPTLGTVPFDVTFDANGSSDPDNDTLTYRWDFGNGDISTDALVTRTFEQAGNFPVTLTVNDGEFDSESVGVTIVANDDPGGTVIYNLDGSRSSIHFVSTKQTNIIETHHFETLSGFIMDTGEATLNIDLNSVETGIDIRNERMRNLLFETSIFGEATVSLSVDLSGLVNMDVGSSDTQDISANLNLHGVNAIISTQVFVTKLSASSILVQNASPIIIAAGDYDLSTGIDALRDIANLAVISYTVPANFTLFFNTP